MSHIREEKHIRPLIAVTVGTHVVLGATGLPLQPPHRPVATVGPTGIYAFK